MNSWRVLILGGSSEASALVQALSGGRGITPVLSLAGRTARPTPQPIATRVGGFGGVDGLAAYIEAERIDILVNATHPFAAQMSEHAWLASQRTGTPLVRLTRDAWQPGTGDRWREVETMEAAAAALGTAPQRVLLTIGRQQLAAFAQAPQHRYLVRTIDRPASDHGLVDATFLEARGPFEAADDEALMREHRIDILVTKNSGGTASAGKLAAARRLRLPVILIRRPAEHAPPVTSVADALAMIEAHRTAPKPRGV